MAQTVNFTYYDRSRPPAIEALVPRHAPIGGRRIHFLDGKGVWGETHAHDGAAVSGPWAQWEGAVPSGGVLLLGSNFAPTHFLWCAALIALDCTRLHSIALGCT